MEIKEGVVYNILKRLDELKNNSELKENCITPIEYLYAKVYDTIKPNRLDNILSNKAKKITLRELNYIAKALHMTAEDLFKDNKK